MFYRFFFFILFISVFLNCSLYEAYAEDEWLIEKSRHFVVHYTNETASWARKILRASEESYTRIASKIGYTRYHDYWTWENRVKIFIYDDAQEFFQKTGQPPWSKGGAIRDERLFRSRAIVTYKQEEGFIDGLLPHEISHLILRDSVGTKTNIPVWFDEGVAQYQEKGKLEKANHIMRNMVRNGTYIPLAQLNRHDIRYERDATKVSIFYIQSITIIDYLIKNFGSQKFGQLCRELKGGEGLERALKKTYASMLGSIDDLEKKWLSYMKN